MVDELLAHLTEIAERAGLEGFGVASADPFEATARTLHERKALGLAGRLGFTYRDPDAATDVRRSFPWARSLVVVARSYVPEAGSPGRPTATAAVLPGLRSKINTFRFEPASKPRRQCWSGKDSRLRC